MKLKNSLRLHLPHIWGRNPLGRKRTDDKFLLYAKEYGTERL